MSAVGVIVNTAAGSGDVAPKGRRVHELLAAAGHTVTDLSAPTLAQATDRARAAATEGLAGLVVVGGDGAVHLGTNVVAGTGLPLGIVPAGTGNDIARALGIPHDVDRAVADIVAALATRPRAIDAVRVGRPDAAAYEWFLAVLSCGFDAAVNLTANTYRFPHGHARYLRAIVAELPRFRPYGYRVRMDDETWESAGTLVAVANTPFIGGGLKIAPDADPEDGLLDVLVAGPFNRSGVVGIFPRLYQGTHVTDPRITVFRARSVTVEPVPELGPHPPVAFADGERIGPLPLRVEIVPGALSVLR
jgi:diacylglycerol kinase (ATP)